MLPWLQRRLHYSGKLHISARSRNPGGIPESRDYKTLSSKFRERENRPMIASHTWAAALNPTQILPRPTRNRPLKEFNQQCLGIECITYVVK